MMKQESQVVDLSQVVEHFAKSYQLPEGVTLVSTDYLLDPVKGKVVLTMMLHDSNVPDQEQPTPEAE